MRTFIAVLNSHIIPLLDLKSKFCLACILTRFGYVYTRIHILHFTRIVTDMKLYQLHYHPDLDIFRLVPTVNGYTASWHCTQFLESMQVCIHPTVVIGYCIYQPWLSLQMHLINRYRQLAQPYTCI